MVGHFRECPRYQFELIEYSEAAFMTYFDEVTRVLTERRVEATLPILTKLRRSFIPLVPVQQEATRLSLGIT